MRKRLVALNCLLFIFFFSSAQNTWIRKADFGGVARYRSIGFNIGNKGYIGIGEDGFTGPNVDFWEYDPLTDMWTQKADYPGFDLAEVVGFSIGAFGYVSTGVYDELYQYDPSTNSWTQKADFAGPPREYSVGFSIDSLGYAGTGYDLDWTLMSFKDFWAYNPATDVWTQKADVGGSSRYSAFGFSIGTKGYIGAGEGDTGHIYDFWEYDPSVNNWTRRADFPATRALEVSFSIGNYGYVGTGIDTGFTLKDDFWQYDPLNDLWTQKANFGGGNRCWAVGFSIGNYGYIGTGQDSNSLGSYTNDFWEYTPDSTTVSISNLQVSNFNFTLSPNPTQDKVIVDIAKDPEQFGTSIEIYNVEGQKKYSTAIKQKLITVDCSLFPHGIYFVKITSGKGSAIKKLLVQ